LLKLLAVLGRHGQRTTLVLGILCGALAGLANTSLIAFVHHTVDLAGAPDRALGWGFAGLCLLVGAARIASSNLLAKLGGQLATEVQIHLSRRILAAPLRRLEEIGPPSLLATLFDDVGAVSEAIAYFPTSFVNLILVLGCLGYMGWLSPLLLAGVSFFMMIGVLAYQWALRAGFRHQRRAREEGDRLFGYLRGLTQGTKELKTGRRRRDEFIQKLRSSSEVFRGRRVAAQRIFTLGASWGNLLFFVAMGLILFLPPVINAFPREVRTGYVLVLLYMSGPLQIVLNSVPMISQANVALGKIERLGLSLLEKEEPQQAWSHDPRPSWQSIELVGVTHSYRQEDHNFTLGPLDLVFRPGELIFVVGGNGSGKTTFAKLLIGLYAPEAGQILWNGDPVNLEHLESYRHLFTVVFSDFYLFEELLGLGSPGLKVQTGEYLKKLRLEQRVRVADGAFSTTELSQGQRKRLALLAAFLEDRPVYVFDEWAADQDPEFKEVFYHQILPELRARGKTAIVISHDDRYYGVASRIIKLESGAVVSDLREAS
jgi:putative ATP-binding cassette transporter